MKRCSTVLMFCASLWSLGCESTPHAKVPTPAPAVPSPAAGEVTLDAAALIRTAQLLRDREFAHAPTLEAGAPIGAKGLPVCAGRCDEERRWLSRVLFAGEAPVVPTPVAGWDAERNVVVWDRAVTNPAVVRSAVLAELVRALDALQLPPAATWDAYLVNTALTRGAGVFVATLDLAQQRSKSVDAAQLAMRPETLYQLDFGANRFADGFGTREGYAFVAALVRSGGWSAVELAHAERPRDSLQIVRPDRYLSGEQPAQWPPSPELEALVARNGFAEVLHGRVGPALFVEWLSRRVPAGVARAGYIGFESDDYRIYAHADGRWTFHWVSLWNTPSTAEQIVEALDAGLRQRADGARFSVLRKGSTVAVIGASTGDGDLVAAGTLLVDLLPVFPQPTPRGVAFVPTPIDLMQSRPLVSSIPSAPWTDAATGLSIDLGALGPNWQLLPTTEPNLPWFGKHASGAVLQYLVEPAGLFDPPFDSAAYADRVRERFVATMALEAPATVTRSDVPTPGGLVIDALGKIKDRHAEGAVHLKAWQFTNRGFVTTLSLQAPPDSFAGLVDELGPLLGSLDLGETTTLSKPGVIEFEIED